jgi:hypothetical protein
MVHLLSVTCDLMKGVSANQVKRDSTQAIISFPSRSLIRAFVLISPAGRLDSAVGMRGNSNDMTMPKELRFSTLSKSKRDFRSLKN